MILKVGDIVKLKTIKEIRGRWSDSESMLRYDLKNPNRTSRLCTTFWVREYQRVKRLWKIKVSRVHNCGCITIKRNHTEIMLPAALFNKITK